MKKQNSLISMSKRHNVSYESPTKNRRSVTFAELAAEEARENALRDDTMSVSDFKQSKLRPIHNLYEEAMYKEKQSKAALKSKKSKASKIESASFAAPHLKMRSKFKPDVQYARPCIKMLKVDDYKLSSGKIKPLLNVGFDKLMKRAKDQSKNVSIYNKCGDDEKSAYYNTQSMDDVKQAGSDKTNTADMEVLRERIIELEVENNYYAVQLPSIKAHVQKLEVNFALQSRKDQDKIAKLESMVKERKSSAVDNGSSVTVSKARESDKLEGENKELRECIMRMNGQIEELGKMQSKMLKAQMREKSMLDSDSVHNDAHEENRQLRELVHQMDAEIRRLYAQQQDSDAYVEEIETHMGNYNSVVEENEELKKHIAMLESQIESGASGNSYELSKKLSHYEQLIGHLQEKIEEQNAEFAKLKSSSAQLQKQFQSYRSKLDSLSFNEAKTNDTNEAPEFRSLMRATEELMRNTASLVESNNKFRFFMQEKTFKSTNGTSSNGYNNSDDLVNGDRRIEYLSCSEMHGQVNVSGDNGDTLRSSATFSKPN